MLNTRFGMRRTDLRRLNDNLSARSTAVLLSDNLDLGLPLLKAQGQRSLALRVG